jgi:hypothetical protein
MRAKFCVLIHRGRRRGAQRVIGPFTSEQIEDFAKWIVPVGETWTLVRLERVEIEKVSYD